MILPPLTFSFLRPVLTARRSFLTEKPHTNSCLASLAWGDADTGLAAGSYLAKIRKGEDWRPKRKGLARRQADGWRAVFVLLPQYAPEVTGMCQRAGVCKPRGREAFWPEHLGRLAGGLRESCFHFEALSSED